jgi:hypothetical protein
MEFSQQGLPLSLVCSTTRMMMNRSIVPLRLHRPNHCPRPGLQSANPKASSSKKLAILFQRHYVNAISTTRSMVYDRPEVIGYSIAAARSSKAVLMRSGSRSRITWASEVDSCSNRIPRPAILTTEPHHPQVESVTPTFGHPPPTWDTSPCPENH